MRRAPFLLIPMIVLALAACGGGGGSAGGSSLPPVHMNSIALNGGWNATGGSSIQSAARASVRHFDSSSRLPQDVSLTALPLIAAYDLPDSYITTDPGGTFGAQIIAYLTTSDKTLNGIPSTLPAVTISQVGPSLVIGSPVPAPSAIPSAPPVSLGGFSVSAAPQPGQTTITLSATVNGQSLSTVVKADTYPGMCVVASDAVTSHGCPAGLYWDAQGVEHTTSSTAAADVYLQHNSDGTSTFEFPYGAAEIKATPTYQVTAVPTLGATSFASLGLFNDVQKSTVVVVFKTQSGLYVKWDLRSWFAGSGSLTTGDIAEIYGAYLVASGTTFSY